MKKWLSEVTPLAAIAALVLSGPAWAGGSNDFGCSNATLQGEYAFGVTNYGNPIVVVAGIEVFDGNGNFTQRNYGGDSSPAEFSPPGQETGTYTVNPDCTGSMVINLNVPGVPAGTSSGVIHTLFVISNGGRRIHDVVSEFTPLGSTGPASTQTSSDAWKVASEQNH
jgi:hypothetical protein